MNDPVVGLPDRLSILRRLVTFWGLCGGLIFVALTLMTVVSITGRWLLSSPVQGDFELIEIGTSLGVFMALPYAQLAGAHIIVDVATEGLSRRAKAILDAASSLLFGAFMAVLAWRLWHGFDDMMMGRDTTMILQIPLWSTFPIIIISTGLAALSCGVTTTEHLRKVMS